MKKFTEEKPLFICYKHPDKFLLKYSDVEPDKDFDRLLFRRATPVEDKDYKIVFGCQRPPEEFTVYNHLTGLEGVSGLVFHERLVHVLQEICPQDFQAFPVTIKNFGKKVEPFENKDYFILNLLHPIDALDKEKSRVRFWDPEKPDWSRIRSIERGILKENCMEDHHLGRLTGFLGHELISPFLANHLRKLKMTKGLQFLADKESYPRLLPEEYLQVSLDREEYEAARRAFVTTLNNSEEFAQFKKYLHLLPRSSVEKLIDLTLERSSFNTKECDELRALLDQRDQQ